MPRLPSDGIPPALQTTILMTHAALKSHLFLIGYRGTGKTTIAQLLAEQLSCDWIDLDAVIEETAGKTIRGLFSAGGEALFRDWETRSLRQSIEDANQPEVISLGGGAILNKENRGMIAGAGRCVWLTATPSTIAKRIGADETSGERRPALTELSPTEEIQSVLRKREPIYRDVADTEISTENRSPEAICREIVAWLQTL